MMEIQRDSLPGQNLPWVEKYRPNTLDDLISHRAILDTLQTFIDDGNLPNLLFYGPPGTGKTSTIKALAKQMYKNDYSKMVLELNASDQRGIDIVRNEIKGFAANRTLTKMNKNSLKLIILDEADMMTQPSQFALRRIVQKYSAYARFCFISNYVSRVIPALQSRCTRFKFKQIDYDSATHRISTICRSEAIDVSETAIKAVFMLCQGDMRRVVNMLQSLSMLAMTKCIQASDVYTFTGNPSPQAIDNYLNILLVENIDQALLRLGTEFRQNGISMQTMVKELYQRILFIQMENEKKAFLFRRLGELEVRLAVGCSEKLALGALAGAFAEVQDKIVEERPNS